MSDARETYRDIEKLAQEVLDMGVDPDLTVYDVAAALQRTLLALKLEREAVIAPEVRAEVPERRR